MADQQFTDKQVQAQLDAIATPEQQVTFEGRSKTMRPVDESIKSHQYMVNANRAASGKRVRQYRLSSSKGI